MIDATPTDYLDSVRHGYPADSLIVDVGAARGDETALYRSRWPRCPVLAIEPTPRQASALRDRFRDDPAVTVCEHALGAHPGRAVLHCYTECEQNSLSSQLGVGSVATVAVVVSTLDLALRVHPQLPPPWLVKIDTQGFDLRVLEGAASTIAAHRPVLQVEVIFARLYDDQCSPADVMAHLAGLDYHLADIRMQHVDAEGRLCYADWIFSPFRPGAAPASFRCRDPFLLAERAAVFERAAEERLELVNRLDEECRARLAIIERLRLDRSDADA